jgi:hypothetical protein
MIDFDVITGPNPTDAEKPVPDRPATLPAPPQPAAVASEPARLAPATPAVPKG